MATWAGVAYVCFIVDAFSRMIVGWRVAAHMRTTMALDALETARASRGTLAPPAEADAWSPPRTTSNVEVLQRPLETGQYTSLRRGQRLDEIGAVPSVGAVGDSYDNALAENVIGLYETELIRGPAAGPWRAVGDVELATLAWVRWHNHQRLHSHLGDTPQQSPRRPTLPNEPTTNWLETNKPSLHKTQVDSLSGDRGSCLAARLRREIRCRLRRRRS